jgi:metal-responsive CopG/Arc/MetJ family transcriptional regulator
MAMPALVMKEKVSNKAPTEKARVQFDFNKESLDKLDEMVEAINATTRAEVIRRALTLFTEVMAAEERGAKIFFREKDGTMIQVMPLF